MVFSNYVGNEIRDRPDGLPLPSPITLVDDNNDKTKNTDACKYPNGGTDDMCEYINDRAEGAEDNVYA